MPFAIQAKHGTKKRWYQENSEQVRQRVTANRQQKIDYYRQQRRDDYRKKTDAYKAAAKALRAKQLEKDPESFRRKEAKRRKEWKKSRSSYRRMANGSKEDFGQDGRRKDGLNSQDARDTLPKSCDFIWKNCGRHKCLGQITVSGILTILRIWHHSRRARLNR
jgi:hypothetical protein